MLLTLTPAGLYCPPGDFYIDPWHAVPRAVVTHAHSDHLRWGHGRTLVSKAGETVTRTRLGPDMVIDTAAYGETVDHNGVKISFHPAGHVLGSAQVRVEHRGDVWVVSGDYKTGGGDPTCAAFEPVRCRGFVTESTFGLPVYRWASDTDLFGEINAWWRANAADGHCSLLFGYALGKAQRLLAGLDPSVGPIFTHGAVERLCLAYREAGVPLPKTEYAGVTDDAGKRVKKPWAGAMIVAPPSALGSPWLKKFAPYRTGYCSGWMTIRGTRRRRAVDRGFVVSAHADWPGLQSAVAATGAETVWVTHGYTAVFSRWLTDRGLDAKVLQTQFTGEAGGEADDPAPGGAA